MSAYVSDVNTWTVLRIVMIECKVCKRIRPPNVPCNDYVCDGYDYGPQWRADMRLMQWSVTIIVATITLGAFVLEGLEYLGGLFK
jgi:hypothetical protein